MKTHALGCEACTVHVGTGLYQLPESNQNRGGNPELLKAELLHFIADAIDNHPRSQQKQIGPSELGTPCARRIGYKLLDVEPSNPRKAAWKPTVGTAVHAWLEQAIGRQNERGIERFYLEERVTVGQVGGVDISGSCDLYDRVTATVIDWKIVGEAALRRYRKNQSPGGQYRAQAHLYGRGFTSLDLPVDTVAVMFLPQNGDLSDAYFWHEPYDEQIALDALNKANGVAALTAGFGPNALQALPTAEAYCTYCPWFRPGSTDVTEGCPGDPGSAAALATAAPTSLADALN